MPTILTHAAVGAGLATLARAGCHRGRLAALSAALAVLPDADVVAFELGVPWSSMWSHRGLTHSLAAAAVAGCAAAWAFSRGMALPRVRLGVLLAGATASHGVLDAFTNGGSGVAFLAPFTAERHFFPWRPIEVSPLWLGLFSDRGLRVLESELRWVWLPLVAFLGVAAALRQLRRRELRRASPGRHRGSIR